MAKLSSVSRPGLRCTAKGWLIDKVIDGHRVFERLGQISDAQAKEVYDKLLADRINARYLPEKQRGSLTVRESYEIYWDEHLKKKRSAYDAKYLFQPVVRFFGDRLVTDMSNADVERYKQQRSLEKSKFGKDLSPGTINAELETLYTALNWLVYTRRIVVNPLVGYRKLEESDPEKIQLDEGYEDGPQWQALRDAADADARPILITLYETGLRPIECFSMRWEWLREAGSDRWLIEIPAMTDGFEEKTHFAHKTPVSPILLDLLKPMRKDKGLVFPSSITKEMRTTIRKSFEGAVSRAGKQWDRTGRQWIATPGGVNLEGLGLTPYCLRRTRATIWDAIDESACRFALGHKPADAHSKHYRDFTPERLLRLVGYEMESRQRFRVVSTKVA